MSDEESNADIPVVVSGRNAADRTDGPQEECAPAAGTDVADTLPLDTDTDADTDTETGTGESTQDNVETMQKMLEQERQNALDYQDKLKHALADFQNLSKKTQSDIENGVNARIDEFMMEFLKIYDDFERAKHALVAQNVDEGMDSILRNMNSLLAKYDVKPIDALGEIFDPNRHEAVSVTTDSDLDDDTIVREIRKGYISHNRVIRPTLVEISKKR